MFEESSKIGSKFVVGWAQNVPYALVSNSGRELARGSRLLPPVPIPGCLGLDGLGLTRGWTTLALSIEPTRGGQTELDITSFQRMLLKTSFLAAETGKLNALWGSRSSAHYFVTQHPLPCGLSPATSTQNQWRTLSTNLVGACLSSSFRYILNFDKKSANVCHPF